MHKGMILLGLLLIAGISFAGAGPWQYDWQGYAFTRYACNIGATGIYKFGFAATYLYPMYMSYSDFTNLNNAANDMSYHVMRMSSGYYDYYPAPFKSDMLGYSADSYQFNTLFNAAIRNYLSLTGESERAILTQWLQYYRDYYYGCITGPSIF